MCLVIFGNFENTFDTVFFLQKPYLRTNYFESNIEEDIVMKNQFKVKFLTYSIENSDYVRRTYVDSGLNDPSKLGNNVHVDFNDEDLDNLRFVKVNSLPAAREHLTPKFYVDEAISHSVDELSLLRLDLEEKLKLKNQDYKFLNSTLTSTKTITEVPTESYVGSLHENSRNGRDFLSVFKDQDNEVGKIIFLKLD